MKDEIHQHILQDNPPEAIGGPVPKGEIESAEKELGVKLPNDYKEYLHNYGSGGVPQYQILGLRVAEFLSDTEESFVEVTKEFREKLPEPYNKMVVVCVDYDGDPVGFLPGEPSIFVIDHESGKRLEMADSFEHLLEKLINDESFF
ncbi:SMI1/KNR4 family protein [Salinithrix halophila]|uniref:SMI1/KNR4 family protein n=1 Tax=Salinithrix halophila TaxID=1485204 RepID=A0ABV8JBD3_9BACL